MDLPQLQKIESAYKGKRVFLTGHTGFKGSWLLYWLHRIGAEVKGYALAPEKPQDLYPQMKGDELCQSIIADIRDRERLIKEIIDFQPDFVFHLAAQPLVRRSYEIPEETFSVNVMGTSHVLDAIKELDKPCVGVMITTDKVYENKEQNYAYRETDRLGGYDPYSASKACAELVISSYRNSFFNPINYAIHHKSIASARAGNVIGGGDWAQDRVIPDIVRALQKDETVILRNPRAVRPWQHVLDPLFGYLWLGACLLDNPRDFSEAWNFGPDQEDKRSVKELANMFIEFWGAGSYEVPDSKSMIHEAGLLILDINKSKSKLDWKPLWNSTKAIEKTVSWYKNFITISDVRTLMNRDLSSYNIEPK